jgi:hypothetical protein
MIPEYLRFIDVHLSLKIIDFLLNISNSNQEDKNELLNLKANQLLQTKLFKEAENFFEENPLLKKEENYTKLISLKNSIKEAEDNLKDEIFGFLNIIKNMEENDDFDFTSLINKKIVNKINQIIKNIGK